MTLSNLLGAIGVLLNCSWPLCRGRAPILLAQALGCLCFLGHYHLIGARTGALMVATSGLQSLLALPLAKYPSFRAVYLLTIPIIAVLTFVSWQGWASLFSAVALALISYARYQISLERLRLFAILSTFCWVGHNLLVASLPGLASDALSLSTGVWMYYRLKTSAEGIS